MKALVAGASTGNGIISYNFIMNTGNVPPHNPSHAYLNLRLDLDQAM